MRGLILIGALALLAACNPAGKPEASTEPAACADGSTRLAGTGLCQSEAAALLRVDPGARSPELADCTWQINETMVVDEALLYRAASCKGVVTTLAYAGGAQSAEISYERSALFGEAAVGDVVIRLFGTDPDPQGALKAALAEAPPEEQAICEIRLAGYEGWPSDALLIAPTAAARAKMPQNEPITACGPLGVDEGSARFWRVAQGFAWFFDLGQEQLDFDAASVTAVAKGADGVWVTKP